MNVVTFCVRIFFIPLLFLFSALSNADSKIIAIDELGWHKQWLHLLHYRPHGILLNKKSENDTQAFFLSVDGKQDPVAELQAAIALFSETGLADNASAQCQFPARYHWLKSYFPQWQDQPCSDLDEFQQQLDAYKLTLIFPASYLNSPSSMYGHTLVRLDRSDDSKSKLLSYSVNFAANADPTDNELVFSYKGLAGGYPGVVSVLPYYVKVNEYSHLEYRDVWEYELNLTKEEVDQFVRHIWETKDTEFDYFFFDENCSYRLLALLDAASERIDVTDDFNLMAVPVDTIRKLDEHELITHVEYRPSAASQMQHKIMQLNSAQSSLARRIADDPAVLKAAEFQSLPAADKARVLEVAVSYVRYLVVKKKQGSPELRQRSLDLLSARSKIPLQDKLFDDVQAPDVRDDKGHQTHKVALMAGEQDNDSYVELRGRVAYHDLTDLPAGYVQGAQIQMGDLHVRSLQGDIRLQKFSVIDVFSVSPRNEFQQPISWRVQTGWDRFITPNDDLFAHLDVGFGYSYEIAGAQVYGLAETRLKSGDAFEDDFQWSGGAHLGGLYQGRGLQLHIQGNWLPALAGDDSLYRDVSVDMGIRLTDNLQLRVEAERQLLSRDGAVAGATLVGAGVHWYF
jgi:hypothetical protein